MTSLLFLHELPPVQMSALLSYLAKGEMKTFNEIYQVNIGWNQKANRRVMEPSWALLTSSEEIEPSKLLFERSLQDMKQVFFSFRRKI